MGDILKNWNNQILIFRLLMHGLRNQIFTLRLRVLYLQYKIVSSIQEIIKNTYAVYNRSSINNNNNNNNNNNKYISYRKHPITGK
jgi:hypothetical protein